LNWRRAHKSIGMKSLSATKNENKRHSLAENQA